ncbi:YhcH/YjgK/YiaL family protein [Streptococcus rifensis]
MIYDQLSELSTYRGLHPNLDGAIDALAELDLVALELGKHDIDGEKAFFMLQQNTLDKEIGPDFEVHRDYLDLHFLLEGKEITKYGFGNHEVSKAYDASIDFGQETCEREMDVVIDPDHFVIYFPGEAHRPNVYANAGEIVKKCVVKVLID